MAARLKVFVTSDGLTDYVVATTSKAKALAAWGSHQDLFKTGSAHETDNPELMKAAAAQPGEVLRKPAGARGRLAQLKPARTPKPRSGPMPAQKRKVADLEARLAALDADHDRAVARLERQRAAVERQLETARTRHRGRRDRLERQLTEARRALG